ncbi:MAG: alpha-fucosidase [Ruminococcaceae bacterium]|nr:alpha-fucosidase [Oscillospiraceae bacterium]
MELKQFLKDAAQVRPSQRQLDWFDTEFYAFVHFTVNTYTGLEWGLGDEDPAIFNPTDLNCDEWVEAVKSAGMKGLILTAKHHDGFCLWPSAYTEHSVKNSPWKDGKGDVVKECADACRRGGIKFGVYLSPWDRHSELYGTPEYNDYYCNQLTELLTNYGELFEVWFDGACGEGPNGKKQEYDFPRYIELIRKYQPNAVIFNDHGPDVRWCGNEAGSARRAEWAVVPSELCYFADVQTGPAPLAQEKMDIINWDENIGEINNIMYSNGLTFAGSEIDMSIRKGWFYHEAEEPHSLERLFNTYLRSCGANTGWNLNVPPMPSGRIDPRDLERLKELGEKIENTFGEKKIVPCTVEKICSENSDLCKYVVKLERPAVVKYVTLREDLTKGQRVETFKVYTDKMTDFSSYNGFTIGHKKICTLMYADKEVEKLEIVITGTRDEVFMRDITVYEE